MSTSDQPASSSPGSEPARPLGNAAVPAGGPTPDGPDHRRAIRAWVTYDWANSAFTTSVVTSVLPVYFSTVAGATLPSPARATQLFSLVTSIALGLTAIISPLLGAYSDLAAAKKRVLAILVGVGAIATGSLWLVTEGDWLMALVLFGIGRIAFSMGNVLYDALLPAVAPPEQRDAISARGFAFGYLGGGLLLAANVAMVLSMPGDLGARWSFVSVAVWWVVFSIPLLRHVPEPPPTAGPGRIGLRATGRQVALLLRSLRAMPDLRRFLIAYLVYNDAVNVVIAVAALYGAELGFGTTELLLAVLLVQFTAGPFALLFGRLATTGARHRGRVAVFLVAMVVLLPVVVIGLARFGPGELVGRAAPDYRGSGDAVGQGEVDLAGLDGPGAEAVEVDPALLASDTPVTGLVVDGAVTVAWVGRDVVVEYAQLPGGGSLEVRVDGVTGVDPDGEPAVVDTAGLRERWGLELTVAVEQADRHDLSLVTTDGPVTLTGITVAPPPRQASLPLVLGVLALITVVAAAVAMVAGDRATDWAERIDARRGIVVALCAYVVVALWGFALDTVVEFWGLALLISVVQGGSQALSRSLYSDLVPGRRAGEFFGLFSILSKFAAFLSPWLFVVSVALWDSSRPAVLALAVMFTFGIVVLGRVDVAAGRRLARDLDAAAAEAEAG